MPCMSRRLKDHWFEVCDMPSYVRLLMDTGLFFVDSSWKIVILREISLLMEFVRRNSV